jgi:tRNA pseudouridine38-40 synthase
MTQGQLNYKLHAITPFDISVKKFLRVNDEAHCRFDAVSRDYAYFIYQKKNPFLADRAFYFPFRLDMESMSEAAEKIKSHQDFTSFSKRNTQVKTFNCNIFKSEWKQQDECWVYEVSANRFLRGMVRAMVATMLQVGRGKLSIEEFESIITSRDCTRASFAVPGRGLFLSRVNFKTGLG